MVTIREPEEKDLMHFTRYSIEFLHVTEPDRKELTERIRERKYWAADQFSAKNPEQKLLFADMGGRVVGYVFGTIEKETKNNVTGYIKEIFIDEFYRREGIGTKVCRALLEWMDQQDVKSVQIALTSQHPRVEDFIHAVGFKPVSTLYEFQKDS